MTTACARDSEVQAQRGAGVTAVHPKGPAGSAGLSPALRACSRVRGAAGALLRGGGKTVQCRDLLPPRC